MIQFACPGCRRPFKVPDEYEGKSTHCPSCKTRIQIPFSVPLPPDLLTASDRQPTPYSTRTRNAGSGPRPGAMKICAMIGGGSLLLLSLGLGIALTASGRKEYPTTVDERPGGPPDAYHEFIKQIGQAAKEEFTEERASNPLAWKERANQNRTPLRAFVGKSYTWFVPVKLQSRKNENTGEDDYFVRLQQCADLDRGRIFYSITDYDRDCLELNLYLTYPRTPSCQGFSGMLEFKAGWHVPQEEYRRLRESSIISLSGAVKDVKYKPRARVHSLSRTIPLSR